MKKILTKHDLKIAKAYTITSFVWAIVLTLVYRYVFNLFTLVDTRHMINVFILSLVISATLNCIVFILLDRGIVKYTFEYIRNIRKGR